MKKFTIIGIMIFALGATAFARGHQNNMHSGSTYCGSGVNQTGFTPEIDVTDYHQLVGPENPIIVRIDHFSRL